MMPQPNAQPSFEPKRPVRHAPAWPEAESPWAPTAEGRSPALDLQNELRLRIGAGVDDLPIRKYPFALRVVILIAGCALSWCGIYRLILALMA
jgi:hypothetical protein